MAELRAYKRYEVALPVVLKVNDQQLNAQLRNVSEGGAQIQLAVGDGIAVSGFDHAGLTKPLGHQADLDIKTGSGAVKRKVQLVHIDDNVIGLSFDQEQPQDVMSELAAAKIKLAGIDSEFEGMTQDEDIGLQAPEVKPWRGARLGIRALWRYSRMLAFVSVNLFWPLISIFFKPKVVFAVYGTKGDQRAYFPDWFRNISPKVVVVGLFRSQRGWGTMVTTPVPENELAEDSEQVRKYIGSLKGRFSSVDNFALVGRLPGFTMKAGIDIEQPLVNGALGTRFAMVHSALQLAEKAQRDSKSLKIAILGGAGRIGGALISDLAKRFNKVIAIDPRYSKEEVSIESGAVIFRTSKPERLYDADVSLVLTARGSDIESLVPWFKPGSWVADDTHPCIKRSIRNRLAALDVQLYKTVVGSSQFAMYPRMPNFNSANIPGCLLEALVINEHGWNVAEDAEIFFEKATNSGYFAELIQPPNDS